MTREEKQTIFDIAKRADEQGLLMSDRVTLVLDLTIAHNQFKLNLNELLNADDENFTHDIAGIQKNVDRNKMEVVNLFVPRYATE